MNPRGSPHIQAEVERLMAIKEKIETMQTKFFKVEARQPYEDGKTWCLIKWRGWWKPKESFKEMMSDAMKGIGPEASEYDEETKRLFIREDYLDQFQAILEGYAEAFRPHDEDRPRKLARAFGLEPKEPKEET